MSSPVGFVVADQDNSNFMATLQCYPTRKASWLFYPWLCGMMGTLVKALEERVGLSNVALDGSLSRRGCRWPQEGWSEEENCRQ